MAIHCNGDKVFYAKRTALISTNDEFFGYQSMTIKLKPKILDLYNTLIKNKSMIKRYIDIHNKSKSKKSEQKEQYELSHISVYGELFGGFYPISKAKLTTIKKNGKNKKNKKKRKSNDDDDKLSEEKKMDNDENNGDNFVVQREILYSPNIEFYAFDVAIILKNMNDNDNNKTRRQYMNYEDAILLFESVKMFYAKPLFIGKYEDCLNYNYEFETNIAKWLGLPPLSKEYGKNLAEGIVIKPMKNIYIEGKNGKLKRPIVKHKHKSFNERILNLDKEFGKFDDRQTGKKSGNEMKGKDMINTDVLLNMINNNRYQSVVSKYGNPSWNKKSSNKKKKNLNNDITINGDNFYVKAIVEDVYDDIKNDKQSAIYQWYHKEIIKNDKLIKYIDNKLIERSIQIVMNNKR